MKRRELISFNVIRDVVRPESNVVQEHHALVRNGRPYVQRIKIYSPDIDTFYNFISTIEIYKFKNRSVNQWNISEWISPKEIDL